MTYRYTVSCILSKTNNLKGIYLIYENLKLFYHTGSFGDESNENESVLYSPHISRTGALPLDVVSRHSKNRVD